MERNMRLTKNSHTRVESYVRSIAKVSSIVWVLILGQACAAHAASTIGQFTIYNDSERGSAPHIATFGQVFKAGQFQANRDAQIVINGTKVPTQIDAKVFHSDGSVRHAIVSFLTPEIRARRSASASIFLDTDDARDGSFETSDDVPNIIVTVQLRDSRSGQGRHIIRLREQSGGSDAMGQPWLDGQLAKEVRYAARAGDQLELIFDVRIVSNGPSRVDLAFHNDWVGQRQRDKLIYDVTATWDGHQVLSATNVTQHPNTVWHQVLTEDGGPDLRISPSLDDLVEAGAVPRYGKVNVNPERLQDLSQFVRQLRAPPLHSGSVEKYMPTTGGRPDIGPLPLWAVVDLITTSKDARRLLMLNADAAGSIPWHFRDQQTRRPITTDQYPALWLDYRGRPVPGVFPEPGFPEEAGWVVDNSHQPSLVYLPYLLSGSRYYKDELAHQATYNLLALDPEYRGFEKSLITGTQNESWNELRGLAWDLRTLANTAYILPADDPIQAHAEQKLRANLRHLVKFYVENRAMIAAGEIEGWFRGNYGDGEGAIAPWQQAFLLSVLGWINDMGYDDAGKLLDWSANFFAGLFTNKERGFHPEYGVAYSLIAYEPSQFVLVNNWRDLARRSQLPRIPPQNHEELWLNYGPGARAAIAAIVSASPNTRARDALRYIDTRRPSIQRYLADDPTFAIEPKGAR